MSGWTGFWGGGGDGIAIPVSSTGSQWEIKVGTRESVPPAKPIVGLGKPRPPIRQTLIQVTDVTNRDTPLVARSPTVRSFQLTPYPLAAWRGQSVDTFAPTDQGAVSLHPAGAGPTNADRGELSAQRRGLSIFIMAPAGDCAVPPHAAGVATPGADRVELPSRRRGPAPALDGAVPPHAAGAATPGADRVELPSRRRGLAIIIITPALDGAVSLHSAGVATPGADRVELPARRRAFADTKRQTGNGGIRIYPTGAAVPSAY